MFRTCPNEGGRHGGGGVYQVHRGEGAAVAGAAGDKVWLLYA